MHHRWDSRRGRGCQLEELLQMKYRRLADVSIEPNLACLCDWNAEKLTRYGDDLMWLILSRRGSSIDRHSHSHASNRYSVRISQDRRNRTETEGRRTTTLWNACCRVFEGRGIPSHGIFSKWLARLSWANPAMRWPGGEPVDRLAWQGTGTHRQPPALSHNYSTRHCPSLVQE